MKTLEELEAEKKTIEQQIHELKGPMVEICQYCHRPGCKKPFVSFEPHQRIMQYASEWEVKDYIKDDVNYGKFWTRLEEPKP